MNHERALRLHYLRIGNCQLKNMLISKIERIQKNMSNLIEKMMELEREQNKEVESFLRVSSLQIPLKRKSERINVPYLQNGRERKRIMQHDIAKKTMELKKAHIKNLSDYDLTRDEINILSRHSRPYPGDK